MTEKEKEELVGFVAVMVKHFCDIPKDINVWVRQSGYQFVAVRLNKRIGRGLDEWQCACEFSVGKDRVEGMLLESFAGHIWHQSQSALAKMRHMEDRRNNELAKVPG